MCTFFCLTWKRNFSAGYIYFLVGYFLQVWAAGGFHSPPQMVLAAAGGKFLKNISLKKNTSLKIVNSLSCEHVSELSHGRQMCTFLGFLSFFAHAGENNLGVFLSVQCRSRKDFWGFCLICLKKLPVIHISTVEFKKLSFIDISIDSRIPKSCQLYILLEFKFFPKNEKKNNN